MEFGDNKINCQHSVRVNHAGDKFIYLSNPMFGAHFHSQKMNLYEHKTGKTKQLIDKVTESEDLFIDSLPNDCFTMDDKNILFVTSKHLNQQMYLYSIDKELLSKIEFPTPAVSILDFNYDIIMASGSDIYATPTIFVAKLNSNDPTDVVGWHQIEDCIHLAEIDYKQYKIPTEDKKSFISAILATSVLPIVQNNNPDGKLEVIVDSEKLPTIVLVHGGPNCAFDTKYNELIVLWARLGFNILMINYRGSTGVNQEYVESLYGKVGELDVADCMTAIRHFTQSGIIDKTKLIIYGGSHGGFLAAHLCCQDEIKFTSAIIRNPVIDISTLQATSDIPDWSYNVSLAHKHFDFTWTPSSKDLISMFECSPMSKVDKANVPTFIQLGIKDRRVNMHQGERWIDLLKARGIDTICKIYNEEHQTTKVENKADFTIQSLIWIFDHLPKIKY